jgi:hypothetical protein
MEELKNFLFESVGQQLMFDCDEALDEISIKKD